MTFGSKSNKVLIDIQFRAKDARVIREAVADLQRLGAVQTAHKTLTVSAGKKGITEWERYSAQGEMDKSTYDAHAPQIQSAIKSIQRYNGEMQGAGNVTYRVLDKANGKLLEGANIYDRMGTHMEDMITFSRKMTWASMSMLGAYFSAMSLVSLMKEGFTSVLDPISDIDSAIEKIAMTAAFAETAGLDPAKILGDQAEQEQRINDTIKLWEMYEAWSGTLGVSMLDLSRNVFLNDDGSLSEASIAISNALTEINEILTDPETAAAISETIVELADVLPDILEDLPGMIKFFADLGTTHIPVLNESLLELILKLGLVAAIGMPVAAAINFVINSVASLGQGAIWTAKHLEKIPEQLEKINKKKGVVDDLIAAKDTNVKVNTESKAFAEVLNEFEGTPGQHVGTVEGDIVTGDAANLKLTSVYSLIERFDETGTRIKTLFPRIDEFGNALDNAGNIIKQFDSRGKQIIYTESHTAADDALRLTNLILKAAGKEPIGANIIKSSVEGPADARKLLTSMGFEVYEKNLDGTVTKYVQVVDAITGSMEVVETEANEFANVLHGAQVKVVQPGDELSENGVPSINKIYDSIDQLVQHINERVGQTLDEFGLPATPSNQYNKLMTGGEDYFLRGGVTNNDIIMSEMQRAKITSLITSDLDKILNREVNGIPVRPEMLTTDELGVVNDLVGRLDQLGSSNIYQSYADMIGNIPRNTPVLVINTYTGYTRSYDSIDEAILAVRGGKDMPSLTFQKMVGGRANVEVVNPEDPAVVWKKFYNGQFLKDASRVKTIPSGRQPLDMYDIEGFKTDVGRVLSERLTAQELLEANQDVGNRVITSNELLTDIADLLQTNLDEYKLEVGGTPTEDAVTKMFDQSVSDVVNNYGLDADATAQAIREALGDELRVLQYQTPSPLTQTADGIRTVSRYIEGTKTDELAEDARRFMSFNSKSSISKETASDIEDTYKPILKLMGLSDEEIEKFKVTTDTKQTAKVTGEDGTFTLKSRGVKSSDLNSAIAERYGLDPESLSEVYTRFYADDVSLENVRGIVSKLGEDPVKLNLVPPDEPVEVVLDFGALSKSQGEPTQSSWMDFNLPEEPIILDESYFTPDVPDVSEVSDESASVSKKSSWWKFWKNNEGMVDVPSVGTVSPEVGSTMGYRKLQLESGIRGNIYDIGMGLATVIGMGLKSDTAVNATQGIPILGDVIEGISFQSESKDAAEASLELYKLIQQHGGYQSVVDSGQYYELFKQASEGSGTPYADLAAYKMSLTEIQEYANTTGLNPFEQQTTESLPAWMPTETMGSNLVALAVTAALGSIGDISEYFGTKEQGYEYYKPEIPTEALQQSPYAGMSALAYETMDVSLADLIQAKQYPTTMSDEERMELGLNDDEINQIIGERLAHEDIFGTSDDQQEIIAELENFKVWEKDIIAQQGSAWDRINSALFSTTESVASEVTGLSKEELYDKYVQEVLAKLSDKQVSANMTQSNTIQTTNNTTNSYYTTNNIEQYITVQQGNNTSLDDFMNQMNQTIFHSLKPTGGT